MEPMFLPAVEQAQARGPYGQLIQMLTGGRMPIPQIFYLFNFKPQATEHLSHFTQEVMRGSSPLSPGMRELIAAFTSSENHCPF